MTSGQTAAAILSTPSPTKTEQQVPYNISQSQLEQMKNICILDINPDTVADARDISIDTDLPSAERMVAYIHQTGNPYFIKVGKILVKMSFSETATTVNDCFMRYMKT